MQPVDRAAVAVVHDAFEHVDELGARVLEQRVGLALLRQRDVQALQPLVFPAQRAQQLVLVAFAGAFTHDARAGAGLGEGGGPFHVCAAEQAGHRHIEPLRQQREGGQAARGLRVLDLAHHRLGDSDARGGLGDGQPLLQPELTHVVADRRFDLEFVDGGGGVPVAGSAGPVAKQRIGFCAKQRIGFCAKRLVAVGGVHS